MCKLIGNTRDLVDWDNVISTISNMTPAYIGPRHKKGDPIKDLNVVIDQWENAGHLLIGQGGSCGWDMFFENQHFSTDVVKTIAEYLKLEPISVWISRVRPGDMAPWHWDANDNEELYNNYHDMGRYSCHISKPDPGHAFTVDGVTISNVNQGDIYEWESRRSWHAGANFGYTDKYVFNIFGHKQ